MQQRHEDVRANGLGDLAGGRAVIVLIALAGLFLYWQANQREVPFAPGARQFNTIPLADEIRLGQETYVQLLRQEQARGHRILCLEPASCSPQEQALVEAVRDVGRRLEMAARELENEYRMSGHHMPGVAGRFDWTYHVIDSHQSNAFCLPGGYVAIYAGMLDVTGNQDGRLTPADIANTDRQAVVMGHEIGHALAHHGAARMSTGRMVQLRQAALAIGVGDMEPGQQVAVMQAFGIAAGGGMMAFSREHETHCFDPRAAPELWERMADLGGARAPEWMSTHPASQTSAGNFREWLPDALAEFDRRCAQPG